MSTITILMLASFAAGVALGAVLLYWFLSARLERDKQQFADELHRLIEREERAVREMRTAA